HALPKDWATMPYDEFLKQRRALMAQVIRGGFERIGKKTEVGPAEPPKALPPDVYLHPKQPYSNELAIRRLVRDLSGSVFWYEQHMDRKILELLMDELDLGKVDEVRLLSGPANITPKTKKAFERFSDELENRGVLCDWRILPAETARTLHARV